MNIETFFKNFNNQLKSFQERIAKIQDYLDERGMITEQSVLEKPDGKIVICETKSVPESEVGEMVSQTKCIEELKSDFEKHKEQVQKLLSQAKSLDPIFKEYQQQLLTTKTPMLIKSKPAEEKKIEEVPESPIMIPSGKIKIEEVEKPPKPKKSPLLLTFPQTKSDMNYNRSHNMKMKLKI